MLYYIKILKVREGEKLSENVKVEIKMFNEILLAIFVVSNYALFLQLSHAVFPWFALIGASIGLSIILLCWVGKRFLLFHTFLIAGTIIFSIAYNWGTLFGIH
jgi:hypothetical protein